MGLGLRGSVAIAADGDKIKSLFVNETDKPGERGKGWRCNDSEAEMQV